MAKIKIKAKEKNRHFRDQLLQILASQNIFATNVYEARDGYVVTLLRQDELETIFSAECQAALNNHDFSSVTPQNLKAKRTILMFNCPEEVTRHTENEIKTEIYRVNEFTTDMIEEITKFKGKPIIKINFKQISVATKAQETGIRLFNMSIPPHQIEEEDYVEVTMCMRCYAMEDHYTNQCPKEKDYKICSECAEEGHHWYTCKKEQKKCINCRGNHRTLAYKCPDRKTIEKNKKNEKKARKERTYSNIASTNTNPAATQQNQNTNINTDSSLKIMTCILLAHGINIEYPDSFEEALNTHLQANNLPKVKVPITPNSRVIFNLPPLTLPNNNESTNNTNSSPTPSQEQSTPKTPTQNTIPTPIPQQEKSTTQTPTNNTTSTHIPPQENSTPQTPTHITQTTHNASSNTSSSQEETEEEIEIEDNQDEEQETENQDEEEEQETEKETIENEEETGAISKNTRKVPIGNSLPSPTPTDTSTTSTRPSPSTTNSPTTDTGNTPTKTQNTNSTPTNRRTRRTQKGKWRN